MTWPEYWERWRNDILKTNIEAFQPEAAAATDDDTMDGAGSSEWGGMSVQYERLPSKESRPLTQMLQHLGSA